MTYPISDVTRRVVYSGSAGTGPYSFSFEILDEGDIAVYENDTLLTITTDYTVTINADGTGSVTLVSASSASDTVAILGNKGIERQTDFVTGGDLFATSLNDELDAQTIFAQQNSEAVGRAIKIPPQSSLSIDTTLPVPQGGYILGWNDTGDAILNLQEIGVYRGTDATVTTAVYNNRDLIKSTTAAQLNNVYICTAASEVGDLLTDTDHFELIIDAVSAATSATNAASSATAAATSATAAQTAQTAAETAETNAETAETNAETAQTAAEAAQAAAESARDSALSAYDNFDDRYLGVKTSDPTVDNDGDALVAGSLYFNSVDQAMKVYDGSNWYDAYANGSSFLQITNNLSDLNNAATARTNLGLEIGTDVQAYDATIVVDADIGVTVQAYDADTLKADTADTLTAPFRGTVTTDNDLSFDMNATNNFKCTPTANGTLTFTNITSGQSGNIFLVNSGGYAISAAATTYISAADLSAISTAGSYFLSYFSDGTNVMVSASAAVTSAGA